MEDKLPKRKHPRLKGFDYSSNGAYFITICTEKRKQLLSNIVGAGVIDSPSVLLKRCGEIVDRQINSIASFCSNVFVDAYVIMPNHVHILLRILNDENGQSGTPAPTSRGSSVLSRFVSTLKRFSNKEIGENIWQRSFHDHIIRDRNDYEEIYRYICENPLSWEKDELYSEE